MLDYSLPYISVHFGNLAFFIKVFTLDSKTDDNMIKNMHYIHEAVSESVGKRVDRADILILLWFDCDQIIILYRVTNGKMRWEINLSEVHKQYFSDDLDPGANNGTASNDLNDESSNSNATDNGADNIGNLNKTTLAGWTQISVLSCSILIFIRGS